MLYENLLQFIVSNYLNRGEAIEVLKSFASNALDQKEAFELLRNAVSDLGNKNLSYLGITVGILFAVVGIPTWFANYQIKKERNEVGDLEKKLEEYESKLTENDKCLEIQTKRLFEETQEIEKTKSIINQQEEEIKKIKLNFDTSKLDFENSNQRTEERLAKVVNDFEMKSKEIEKHLEKQGDEIFVKVKLYHNYSEIGKDNQEFYSYMNYVDEEVKFFKKHGELSEAKSFDEIIDWINSLLVKLKNINKPGLEYLNEVLSRIADIPELEDIIKKIRKKLEDLSEDKPK